MSTLYDVQDAWEAGERREAVSMLQQILRDEPSANAWYMAALLTRDQNEAIRHLRRALALEPDHEQSRQMLKELGGENVNAVGSFWAEIAQTIYDQSERSPFLKHLPKPMQLVASGLIFTGIIAAFVAVAAMLLDQRPPGVTSDVAPTAVPVSEVSVGRVTQGLEASELAIAGISATSDERIVRGDMFSVSFLDLNGQVQTMTLLVFDSAAAMAARSNRDYFRDVERYSAILGGANVALVVPNVVSDADVARIDAVINAIIRT